MTITNSSYTYIINVGRSDIWLAVCSTIRKYTEHRKNELEAALTFLETGNCPASKCLEAARQFNLIRDELAKHTPDEAVYDIDDLSKEAPWKENISPIITSCANYFTTADGNDLLAEIVKILSYSGYTGKNVLVD